MRAPALSWMSQGGICFSFILDFPEWDLLQLYPGFSRVGYAPCSPALQFGVSEWGRGTSAAADSGNVAGWVLCAELGLQGLHTKDSGWQTELESRRVSGEICVTRGQLMSQPGDMSSCDSQPEGGHGQGELQGSFPFPWKVLAGCCC